MTPAKVQVIVEVELDVDTERPITALDESVLNAVRRQVGEILNAGELDYFDLPLGHYVDRVTATVAILNPVPIFNVRGEK